MLSLARLLLAAIALPALPPPSLASPSPQDGPAAAESFEEELAAARDLAERGKWRGAESAILDLLERHRGADYVAPHLRALREDLYRASFWKGVREPDPKDLVSGDLLRYSRINGSLKVRYDHTRVGDFEYFTNRGQNTSYTHPAHFADTWSIELEGTPGELSGPSIFLRTGPETGYVIKLGNRVEGAFVYYEHVIERLAGGEQSLLEKAEPAERKKDSKKPAEARIEIRRSTIRVTYDKKKVFEVDREEDDFGQLVLVHDGEAGESLPFGEMTIEGEVDRGWIAGLVDGAVSEERAAFDAKWEEPEVFSAWTLAEAPSVVDVDLQEVIGRLEFQFRLESDQRKLYDQITPLLGKGSRQSLALLEQLGKLPDAALPEDVFAYVRFHCALDLDRAGDALAQVGALRVAPGQELDLAIVRGYLQRRAGDLAEARASFEELATSHPTSSLAHVQLAEALLLASRHDEAYAAIQRGRAALPASPALIEMEDRIVKATRGPSWERALEEAGDHFVVRFEGSRKDGRTARKVLDEAWERCVEFFGPLPDPPADPSVAYVFQGESSYLDYVKGVSDLTQEATLGIYSPYLKQVAVWKHPSITVLETTLRHECAHRYLDLLVGYRIPRWLNEGLAEVFAASWEGTGEYVPGTVHPAYRAYFRQGAKLLPAEAFMRQRETGFLQDPTTAYAQAWGLVHFLRFGEPSDGGILTRILTALREGADPGAAIDAGLAGVDGEDLGKRFLAWLNGLKKGS